MGWALPAIMGHDEAAGLPPTAADQIESFEISLIGSMPVGSYGSGRMVASATLQAARTAYPGMPLGSRTYN